MVDGGLAADLLDNELLPASPPVHSGGDTPRVDTARRLSTLAPLLQS